MSEAKHVDLLTVLRSQPVQGQSVQIRIQYNDWPVATGTMPFVGWIKLNKLLQKGMELDARENHGLQLRLKIAGLPEGSGVPAGLSGNLAIASRGSVSLLAQAEQEAEAEGDEDLKAVIEAEKAQAPVVEEDELVRSLRGESE